MLIFFRRAKRRLLVNKKALQGSERHRNTNSGHTDRGGSVN